MDNLEAIDEVRDEAAARMSAYQLKSRHHYNKDVRLRSFEVGQWVLRKVFQNTQESGSRKLGPNWEGPFEIIEIVGNGAYRLRTKEGRNISRSWNANHLKAYHF